MGDQYRDCSVIKMPEINSHKVVVCQIFGVFLFNAVTSSSFKIPIYQSA